MANDFCWFELVTPDTEAAKAFYGAIIGWDTELTSGPAGPYTIFKTRDGVHVGGMLEMRDMPPAWLGYVAVDDVDAFAGKIATAGGQVHKPPQDIPDVGRFAVVADPQGAMFVLFKDTSASPPPRPAPRSPGALGWTELHAIDWETAFPFYEGVFGWVKHDAISMGEMGTYQVFGLGEVSIGGMMSHQTPAPGPYWLYYFSVEDIDGATQRIIDAGGRILMSPTEVPGGLWVANAMDPQGGLFAILGPKA